MNKKPLFVLLGGGFISGSIEHYVRELGHNYIVIDRSVCDFLDDRFVEYGIKNIPKYSKLILLSSITRLIGNDYLDFNKNIKILENILTINRHIKGHIIYLSSIDVYGVSPKLPITENNNFILEDYYSLSKIVSEFMVRNSSEEIGCRWTIFRLPGIYGKSPKDKSVIKKLITSALSTGIIKIYGNGFELRDYVLADDVAKIIVLATTENISGVFNIATGSSRSIKEISEMIANKTNAVISAIDMNANTNRNNSFIFDINKFKLSFVDCHLTQVNEGIDQCIRFYSK